jgi:hypothetical protein
MSFLRPRAGDVLSVEPPDRDRDEVPARPADWIEHDSSCWADASADLERMARACEIARARLADPIDRSFAILRGAVRPHIDDVRAGPGSGAIRTGGRQYSLALLALLDALAAEPAGSPLATPLPLDDLRATALVVAGECMAAAPDVGQIEQTILRADRQLAALRMPLRATGYFSARDALRGVLDSLVPTQRAGPNASSLAGTVPQILPPSPTTTRRRSDLTNFQDGRRA